MGPELLAAKVWHYWLSVAIIIPVLLVVVGIIIGYLHKVVAPKYGRR